MITKNRGFSLIELLVTVAIVALISGASFQFYQEYSAKVYRSEAIIALTYQAGKMEECRARSGNLYSGCGLVICRSLTDSTNAGCLQANRRTLAGHYRLAPPLINGAGTAYLISASLVAPNSKDASCMDANRVNYDLVINQLGQYGISLGGAVPVFGTAQARKCWSK